MALQFPSRTTVRWSLAFTAVGGSLIGAGSLLLGVVTIDGVSYPSYACILAGVGTWFAVRRGLHGPVLSARDHLRPGERRRLRLLWAAGVALALVVPAYSSFTPPVPVWASLALAPCFGTGAVLIVHAMQRLARDPARRGCPGAWEDCRDCDTIVPIVELRESLDRVEEAALGIWSIDPDTGAEVSVGTDRLRVSTHTIDDTGHETARMYLLAKVIGTRVPRLVPVTAYQDGFPESPDLTDEAVLERMSLGADGVRAVQQQVDRTWGRTRQSR
ncbi:hypothetical protein [Glycomyces sp. NPDC047010]|uniref:hypothetical protein n=1 Tax=Glycomyces sp. NPDC047010 TaxID=3155023 RepID=UPI0033F67B54